MKQKIWLLGALLMMAHTPAFAVKCTAAHGPHENFSSHPPPRLMAGYANLNEPPFDGSVKVMLTPDDILDTAQFRAAVHSDDAFAGALPTKTATESIGLGGGEIPFGTLDLSSYIKAGEDFTWPQTDTAARDLVLLQRVTTRALLGGTLDLNDIDYNRTAGEIGKIFEYRFVAPVGDADSTINGISTGKLTDDQGHELRVTVETMVASSGRFKDVCSHFIIDRASKFAYGVYLYPKLTIHLSDLADDVAWDSMNLRSLLGFSGQIVLMAHEDIHR